MSSFKRAAGALGLFLLVAGGVSLAQSSSPQGTGIGAFARFRRQVANPPSPPTGYVDYFTDDGTGHYFSIDSSGTVTDLQSGGGGGGISLPNGQIGYGTGSGVASSTKFRVIPTTGTLVSQSISGESVLELFDDRTADVDLGNSWHSKILLQSSGVEITASSSAGFFSFLDSSGTERFCLPTDNGSFTDGCFRSHNGALEFSNDGSTWTDVGSGGSSTGNYTFSGNTMDLSASGAMTIGSTNTTATTLQANGGAAALKFLLDATFGSPYYDLQLTTPSAVLNIFDQGRDGISIAGNQLFDYIAGVAQTSLTTSRFQPTTAGGLNLGTDSVPWGNITGYSYSTRLGTQITAAASITPTTGLQHWTGATTVTTIVATNFPGNCAWTAICDVTTCTYGTGGNIGAGGTFAQNTKHTFQYDATATTWYP